MVNLTDLKDKVKEGVSGFYFETPNFFGPIEAHADEIRSIVGTKMMVVGVNPMSLALLRPPGDFGADIVIGDAQVFGIPMNLGGPMIGLFGCKVEHVRKMPGRLIGMTADLDGKRAYCMTLQTREQHIRRSKATSNICTNEALLALAAAAYLSVVGRNGLRQIAAKNIENAQALIARVNAVEGFKAPHFKAPRFNEFVVDSKLEPDKVNKELLAHGVQGGVALDKMFPELGRASLYATTEMHSKSDHDKLVAALGAVR
jgi:glycine dehydrogenase subunit 1